MTNMQEQRNTTAWTISGVLFVLIAAVGLYAFAYVQRCEDVWDIGTRYRIYASRWEAKFFKPAAAVESLLRREKVHVWWRGGGIPVVGYHSVSDCAVEVFDDS